MLIDDIEKAVRSILEQPLAKLHSYKIRREGGLDYTALVVTCQSDENELSRAKVLTVNVLDEAKEIQIPTLYLPDSLRGNKVIFRTLQEILKIGLRHNYVLLIVDMVASFHGKMLSIGAREIDEETVQITPATKLT